MGRLDKRLIFACVIVSCGSAWALRATKVTEPEWLFIVIVVAFSALGLAGLVISLIAWLQNRHSADDADPAAPDDTSRN